MDARKLLETLSIAKRLKDVTRHCYTKNGRHESVAEHSWMMTLMAFFIKDEFPEADIPDKENIDIVYDLHIRRIFSRMGLCKKYSMNEAVTAARILNPGFPGYLTSSLWAIGRQICRPTNPQCDNCPINKFCEHLLTETPV